MGEGTGFGNIDSADLNRMLGDATRWAKLEAHHEETIRRLSGLEQMIGGQFATLEMARADHEKLANLIEERKWIIRLLLSCLVGTLISLTASVVMFLVKG